MWSLQFFGRFLQHCSAYISTIFFFIPICPKSEVEKVPNFAEFTGWLEGTSHIWLLKTTYISNHHFTLINKTNKVRICIIPFYICFIFPSECPSKSSNFKCVNVFKLLVIRVLGVHWHLIYISVLMELNNGYNKVYSLSKLTDLIF